MSSKKCIRFLSCLMYQRNQEWAHKSLLLEHAPNILIHKLTNLITHTHTTHTPWHTVCDTNLEFQVFTFVLFFLLQPFFVAFCVYRTVGTQLELSIMLWCMDLITNIFPSGYLSVPSWLENSFSSWIQNEPIIKKQSEQAHNPVLLPCAWKLKPSNEYNFNKVFLLK